MSKNKKQKKSAFKEVMEIPTLKKRMCDDAAFNKFCFDARIEPTKRQYSRFLHGKGFVYKKYINHDEDVMYSGKLLL